MITTTLIKLLHENEFRNYINYNKKYMLTSDNSSNYWNINYTLSVHRKLLFQ